MDKIFLARDVQAIARISKSTLKNWIEAKAIVPLRDERGRGAKRQFSKENVYNVMVCRELSFIGVKPRYFRTIIDIVNADFAWSQIEKNPLKVFFLVISYPRSINSKTGMITNVVPWAKLVPADKPDELGNAVASNYTTTTINLSQLYKDAAIG
jgi:hypothetical protein